MRRGQRSPRRRRGRAGSTRGCRGGAMRRGAGSERERPPGETSLCCRLLDAMPIEHGRRYICAPLVGERRALLADARLRYLRASFGGMLLADVRLRYLRASFGGMLLAEHALVA